MNDAFMVQQIGAVTVVQFLTSSLMDTPQLQEMREDLARLVDEEDHRWIVLDFERVQYLSSQAVGILMELHAKLLKLPKGQLVLCGVGPRLMELLRIVKLDRVLTIKPTQREALAGQF